MRTLLSASRASRYRLLLALLLALSTMVAVAPRARANGFTFFVVNGNDSGTGSLRQAIINAGDGDTIKFRADLIGGSPPTINLTSELQISENLTVDASEAGGVRLRSSGFGRVLSIAAGATVTLNTLTFSDGAVTHANGGGILNQGTLTLIDSILRGNNANAAGANGGGIANSGNLTASGTIFIDNHANGSDSVGGAIVNTGTMTLTNSGVIGNSANLGGGGIRNTGTLTVTNTNVAGNSVPGNGSGGGIANNQGTLEVIASTITGNSAHDGAGIHNYRGPLTLTNSTISTNGNPLSPNATGSTGGGLANVNALATLSFVTVTRNSADDGAGIYSTIDGESFPTSTTVARSIVVGNPGQDCFTTTPTFAPIISAGMNVLGVDCPTNGTGDAVVLANPDTVLDPDVATNGGPTSAHAIPFGSPARDRVSVTQCNISVDQRGIARHQGAACDSGAYELLASRLSLAVVGNGTAAPLGGAGEYSFLPGDTATLTPQPANGQTFTGWLVDGTYAGWAVPLTLTMDADHDVQATFAPTKTFPSDVPTNRPDFEAITELASRGYILGYNASSYGPGDGVQRAQMAALISRSTPLGPGTPTNGALTPPACTVADTWDCEDWGNTFTDQGGIDPKLWRNAGTLQHYEVARGYTTADCAARGRAFPCYGPTDPVSHAQTIAFITRAMIVKGYWVAQPNAPLFDPGVPNVLAIEARTFAFYTSSLPFLPNGKGWNDGATRGWFAEALWAALDSYWGSDSTLPDGRPAGGKVP